MLKNSSITIFFRRLVLVGTMLGLGACAGGIGSNSHYMASTDAKCCDSFETMTYKMLPAGKKVRIAIDAADPAYQFKNGYSHYEALALPNMAGAYLLQLESEVVREKRGEKGRIFYPVVTFLDKDKQLIERFEELPYTFQSPFYGRNHIRASVRIAGDLADARYVLVHTNDTKINQAIATSDGKSILQSGGFDTMIFAPITKPRYRIDFAREGWLRVLAYAPK